MRYYVAKFDFEAGEVGVPFIHGVEARDTVLDRVVVHRDSIPQTHSPGSRHDRDLPA
ncbi:MAG: hypothetical protein O3A93_11670 [Chloroflexi bacterium]|nr:hypothetical protein [Chloroflexota bacterium]